MGFGANSLNEFARLFRFFFFFFFLAMFSRLVGKSFVVVNNYLARYFVCRRRLFRFAS